MVHCVAEGSCSRRLLLWSFSYCPSSVLLPREGSSQLNTGELVQVLDQDLLSMPFNTEMSDQVSELT